MKKKAPALHAVHHALFAIVNPEQIEVELWRADEPEVRCGLRAALDEMWSVVARKTHPRWLWHAMDHHTGSVFSSIAMNWGWQSNAGSTDLKHLRGVFPDGAGGGKE